MNPFPSQVTLPATKTLILKWKCGSVCVGNSSTPSASEGPIADWSDQGIRYDVAYEQLRIIVGTSLNALKGMRRLVDYTNRVLVDLKACESDEAAIPRKLADVEAFLVQMAAFVKDASLGAINLLGDKELISQIPYLQAEVEDGDSYHCFVTMGISISEMWDMVSTSQEKETLLGLHVSSADEINASIWVQNPRIAYEMQMMEVDLSGLSWDWDRFYSDLLEFQSGLAQFDHQLQNLESQLDQYIKMVDEVIADPVLKEE